MGSNAVNLCSNLGGLVGAFAPFGALQRARRAPRAHSARSARAPIARGYRQRPLWGRPERGKFTALDRTECRPTPNSDASNQLEDVRNYLGYDDYGDVTDTSQSNKSIGAVGEP